MEEKKNQGGLMEVLKELQRVQAENYGKLRMWIHTCLDEMGEAFIVATIFSNKEKDENKSFRFYGFKNRDDAEELVAMRRYINTDI